MFEIKHSRPILYQLSRFKNLYQVKLPALNHLPKCICILLHPKQNWSTNRVKSKTWLEIYIGYWAPGRAVWYWMLAWTPSFLKVSSAMYMIFCGAPAQLHWRKPQHWKYVDLLTTKIQSLEVLPAHLIGLFGNVKSALPPLKFLIASVVFSTYLTLKNIELICCHEWELPVVGADPWCVKSFW